MIYYLVNAFQQKNFNLGQKKNIKELILENENNRKNNHWNIIIGLCVLALSLFMCVVFLFGIDFSRITWFIDAPSIIILRAY